jgi:para-aminobenzoate synthetase / 4-amino-4-deoxychorismate lyase
MNRRHSLPAEVYSLVDATPATVLLEGGSPRRWTDPSGALEVDHPIAEPTSWTRLFLAPWRICVAHQPAEIPALFQAIESAVASGLFAAGFFSYECGQAFEPKAQMRSNPNCPLAWFGIYDRAYIFDHATGEFMDGDPPGPAELRQRQPAPEDSLTLTSEFPLTESEYAFRVEQIHEWIRAGDVYQLNFTAPLRINVRTQADTGAAALYARLRARQPVDYGAFIHWQPGRRILSFSPELFFRLDPHIDSDDGAHRIVTRPMKGTAPRGRNPREDREQAAWLQADRKNRSENLMIVDLLRNDLGRIARFGTVRVDNLFAVERHPTLWQMTSTISAELREGIGFEAIFRALFPSGSVTGAPKVRAMQLIAKIEDVPRGVYTGAIGFFSPGQTVFNVAIRTLTLEGKLESAPDNPVSLSSSMGVGSGIVIDSDPAQEYRECLLKAEFLTRAPIEFSLVETILWKPGFPFLNLHLERLAGSADYFDFPCDLVEIRSALQVCARIWADPTPRKVRLLLNSEGAFALTAQGFPSAPDPAPAARVRISSTRTDPSDPMLFHKTTHRPLYTQEFEAAVQAGFDDVLFFNVRGELTEGAISNVILEIDGRWFTPPVACGLLAGVYRRHLLEARVLETRVLESRADETHPGLEERVLFEEDLRRADAVYICNAVRGLRRATIDWQSSANQ